MGLAVCVGLLADLLEHDSEGAEWLRQGIAGLNTALAENGLPSHREPEQLELPSFRGCHSFPYSFLHYLRRAYAYSVEGLPAPTGELTDEQDALVTDVSTLFESHLLCHSDAEGYYVPQDFAEPIFHDSVPGGMLGSSVALLRELRAVAPAIEIELHETGLPGTTLDALADVGQEARYYQEWIVWLALWEAAQASADQGTLLVFS